MKQTDQNQLVRTNEIEWQPLNEAGADGVFVKSLLFDEAANRADDSFEI